MPRPETKAVGDMPTKENFIKEKKLDLHVCSPFINIIEQTELVGTKRKSASRLWAKLQALYYIVYILSQ
jgi:hypothetical protein